MEVVDFNSAFAEAEREHRPSMYWQAEESNKLESVIIALREMRKTLIEFNDSHPLGDEK